MKNRPLAQSEMIRVVEAVRRYFEVRLQREMIATLNETIRNLRILLQEILIDHYLVLPLPKAKEFRFALGDQLSNVCEELRQSGNGTKEDDHHHRHCTKEILACFEWAEQIRAEIPDDPVTQKVLALDIPILRPFDYGLEKGKPVKRR